MDNLGKVAYEAINNYFSALTKLGYLDSRKVNQLWLLLFLQDFLNTFEWIITEEDYTFIDSILTCLQSSCCLIPYSKTHIAVAPIVSYPYSKTGLTVEPIKNYLLNIPIRETESSETRAAEDSTTRLSN